MWFLIFVWIFPIRLFDFLQNRLASHKETHTSPVSAVIYIDDVVCQAVFHVSLYSLCYFGKCLLAKVN